MDALANFMPMDRRQSLVRGDTLPDYAVGAALLADIAGFTPLTEAFVEALGPQRGAEELTATLNQVYHSLTAEIDRYGGSIVGMSGDALTCWFDGDDGRRATTCAFALKAAMATFASLPFPTGGTTALALKVAVAHGPVRRFLVGSSQRQVRDVLAGTTLERLITAEHLARQSDVVLDPETVMWLKDDLCITEWRTDSVTGARYAVVSDLLAPAPLHPWPVLPPGALDDAEIRPWLSPAIYERLQSGHSAFLTELRPAVALFLRFGGLDYDGDPLAGQQLDRYVRWVQEIAARYEGELLQVTIGEKGSYLYIAFGAPVAHLDDAARAVGAALELRSPPPELMYITGSRFGISGGRARTGIYGGTTCCYGVLGDAVNLAARLMQAAAPGQILVDERLAPAAARRYILHPLAPIQVKGKREPVATVAVEGMRQISAIRLQEPQYALPLLGRQRALAQIEEKLALAQRGQGQIIGITAEAGMGKSRLVAEIIRRATAAGMTGFGGEAQPYGTSTAYLAWKPIWRAFFDLDPVAPAPIQIAGLERELGAIDPALLPRMSLLRSVLDLPIAENELTRGMDARLRMESLQQLLLDCLRARAADGRLLIVLEDVHWLDVLSSELLTAVARVIADLPVLLVLAYRPLDGPEMSIPAVALPYAVEIHLGELTLADSQQLIALKLNTLFGSGAVASDVLVERITARAQGNPFYIEELLTYLHDCGVAPNSVAALEELALPDSLARLILSRIDQLPPEQQMTLKVASIIGRVFAVSWLWGVHPDLGSAPRVHANLEALARLDLTPIETYEPELRCLFKHVMIQEVAYESLSFALRAQLHERLAWWLEERTTADPPLDLLAFHYGRSGNLLKQREYFRRAGDAAATRYANAAAVDYYERLLALLDVAEHVEERIDTLRAIGEVLERTGALDTADQRYREALSLAVTAGNLGGQARAQLGLGIVRRMRGTYAEALPWLEQARAAFAALNDPADSVKTLMQIAYVYFFQGSAEQARALAEEARKLALEYGETHIAGQALHLLGNLARNRDDRDAAYALWTESIAVKRTIQDKLGIAATLANMGLMFYEQGDLQHAQSLIEESQGLFRDLGARREHALVRGMLAPVLLAQGRADEARRLLIENLVVLRDLGARWELARDLVGLAQIAVETDQSLESAQYALRLSSAAASQLAAIGGVFPVASDRARMERAIELARSRLEAAAAAAAWAEGWGMSWVEAIAYAINPFGITPIAQLELEMDRSA